MFSTTPTGIEKLYRYVRNSFHFDMKEPPIIDNNVDNEKQIPLMVMIRKKAPIVRFTTDYPTDNLFHGELGDLLAAISCDCGCELKLALYTPCELMLLEIDAQDLPIIPLMAFLRVRIIPSCPKARPTYAILNEKLRRYVVYGTTNIFSTSIKYNGTLTYVGFDCMLWSPNLLCKYPGIHQDFLNEIGSKVLPDDILMMIYDYLVYDNDANLS